MAEADAHQQTDGHQGPLCQICDVTKPSLFCKECMQSMCVPCKQRHDMIRNFDKHAIAYLCDKHIQPLTHICHTCIVGMCIKCMLNDHAECEQGKGFETFTEGVENLRKKSKELEHNMQRCKKKMEEEISHVKTNLEEVKGIKSSLKNLRAAYVDKITKIDNLLNEIEENYEAKGESTQKRYCQLLEQCDTVIPALNIEGKDDRQVIADYTRNDSQAHELLQETMALLTDKLSKLDLEKYDDSYKMCLEEAGINICRDITTVTPKQVLVYTGDGENKIKNPIDVAIASPDSVIVADFSLGRVFCIHRDGKLLETYTSPSKSKGGVTSAVISGGHCYILQEGALTKVCLENPANCWSVDPGIQSMYSISKCHGKQDTFYITSWDEKAVYEFDFTHNKKKKVLQADTVHWYINKTDHPTYLLTCLYTHVVKEYDEKWSLLRTIGSPGQGDGQLNGPMGITVTPSGHILVADHGNNRVSCFNSDGSFNKHILTEKDGINKPSALALRFPYLWITQRYSQPCLKCFKF